jgi:hypothetical protein
MLTYHRIITDSGTHPHKANAVKTENKKTLEDQCSSEKDDTESINNTLKSMGLSYCVTTPRSSSSPSPRPSDTMDWIIDSGSTVHITNDESILFNYNTAGAKTVEVANGQFAQTAGCGEIAFHARGNEQLVRIEEVHLVHGRLNLLDVDRLVDIGFSDPQFSSRKLIRGGITWPLRPNTRPGATWRVKPIKATPAALANIINKTKIDTNVRDTSNWQLTNPHTTYSVDFDPATTAGGILDVNVNISFPAPSVRGESCSNQVNILLAEHTEDIDENIKKVADLNKDSKSTGTEKNLNNQRSKHIDLRYHHIRD